MTNYREILRLSSLGLNNSQVAVSCGCSRTTVVGAMQRAKEAGISWDDAKNLSDKELHRKLFPVETNPIGYEMPDYDYVHKEMGKDGVTLGLLWLEYCDKCRLADKIPYKQTQFYKYYRDYLESNNATMHITRKPGERMEVDWAGQTAKLKNNITGEPIVVYIFVATLPYSGYSYVEGFLTQCQESWTTAHVNAFKYFGGAAKILVPDNLKTGVSKVTKHEVIINRAYQELAEHYGVAIIPARVRTPKDKASVEGTVGVISTWILASLRKSEFFSLSELNDAIYEKLYEFNNKPFQKKEGSRASMLEEESQHLMPLPDTLYELSEWRIATVQYNYHITIENQNYSVPYEYIKYKVDVRLTKRIVEVFCEGSRISSHVRLYGKQYQYSTKESHMPPNHQRFIEWNGNRFREWAKKVGESTCTVITNLLNSYKIEQQAYKACMALLKLESKYSTEMLEAACNKALSYTNNPGYKGVSTLLKSGQVYVEPTKKQNEDVASHSFTRGSKYYMRGDEQC